jgi:hypothetical protein
VNLQAYANHRKAHNLIGQTRVSVLRAINSGRLEEPAVRREGRGWVIDPALADEQWATRTGVTVNSPRPPAAAVKQPRQRISAGSTAPSSPGPGGPSYAEARRAREVYRAERERLELMKEKAELVLAAEVRQEASRLARQVRDLLLIIPNRLAAKLAGMTDQDQVRSELQAEIESALRGLADA